MYERTYLLSPAGSDIARALPGGNTALTWLSLINGLGPNSTKDPNTLSPGFEPGNSLRISGALVHR